MIELGTIFTNFGGLFVGGPTAQKFESCFFWEGKEASDANLEASPAKSHIFGG